MSDWLGKRGVMSECENCRRLERELADATARADRNRDGVLELGEKLALTEHRLDRSEARCQKLEELLREAVDIGFGSKDWACKECRPYSECLIEGFVCPYHAARAALAPDGADVYSAEELAKRHGFQPIAESGGTALGKVLGHVDALAPNGVDPVQRLESATSAVLSAANVKLGRDDREDADGR